MNTDMQRQRVAAGIHRDRYGFDVRVKVRHVQRTKRYPFEAALDTMKAWQHRMRSEILEATSNGTITAPPTTGTLEAEAPRYLSQIEGRISYKADLSHLRAWLSLYGSWPTSKITTAMVNEAYSKWQKEGYSNQTIIHRRRVLRELYQMLYGKKTDHPVEDARRVPKPRPQPVHVPNEIIMEVDQKFRALNLPVEYAIFRVLATTGQRAGQVNAARRVDVDLKRQSWNVPSAKGESAHVIYLSDDMLAAWKLFIEANAWGKVDTCKQADLMRQCGWPDDIRPYNLRHSVAFSAMEKGADIGDVQLIMGHRYIETTRQNYAPGQEARMRQMSQLLNGRLGEPKGKK